MSHEPDLATIQRHWPQTFKSYLVGFLGSLFLTSLSFWLADRALFARPLLIVSLIFLAVTQAFVQLVYFMHMGQENRPRWMTLLFYFMVLVLAIIVGGSLWIIHDLDQRTMPDMAHW